MRIKRHLIVRMRRMSLDADEKTFSHYFFSREKLLLRFKLRVTENSKKVLSLMLELYNLRN